LGDVANVSDALVKLLIQGSGGPFRQLHLGPVVKWLNVDLPRTQNRQVDLLGRRPPAAYRIAEHQPPVDALPHGRIRAGNHAEIRPISRSVVDLCGQSRIANAGGVPHTEGMVCQYRLVDIRSLDANALLASERIEDNILAVLAGLEDSVEGIRAVLRRIAKLTEPLREEVLQHLLVTCGIRGLAEVCKKELKTMPITLDLSHDPLFASYIERGRLKGEKQGRKEGLLLGQQKGRREGRLEGVRQVGRATTIGEALRPSSRSHRETPGRAI
jgi:hypothetical protein